MVYTKLAPRFTVGAKVEEFSPGNEYRLSIPAGAAAKYRLAQLDDYAQTKRSHFPWRPPLHLSLSARTSSHAIPGTWGFGLWNDPFGLSLGFGGNPLRLPTLPNAAWFFSASKENYLSFKSGQLHTPAGHFTPAGHLGSAPTFPANGFLTQVFRAPRFHPLLIPAGIALPFSRKATRQFMGKIIEEDAIAINADVTQWHKYQLDWREKQVSFEVDDIQVFESPFSPDPPLGLVIWIDNQFAAFTPEGKIGFGVLENPEPAWLEIKDIEVL
ncbi:MAG TPA: hypothetical protein VK206_20605 [Anaerolineales bacterium]|nr:hypothetical protein [Anaerolineales bacterium]HLO30518.1 hypothetical protein [Anaerolineales bacterium]